MNDNVIIILDPFYLFTLTTILLSVGQLNYNSFSTIFSDRTVVIGVKRFVHRSKTLGKSTWSRRQQIQDGGEQRPRVRNNELLESYRTKII